MSGTRYVPNTCSRVSFQDIYVRLGVGEMTFWPDNNFRLSYKSHCTCPDITCLISSVRCFKKRLNKTTTWLIIGRFWSTSPTTFSAPSMNSKIKFYFRPHRQVLFLLRNKSGFFFYEQKHFWNSNILLFALAPRKLSTNFF